MNPTTTSAIKHHNVLDHPSKGPKITYEVRGQPATDADVDSWELRAARRALANIKTLLKQQQMLDLVRPQCEQGDTYFQHLVAISGNQWRECRTDLHVSGPRISDLMSARKRWLTSGHNVALQKLLPAHPEHYAMPPYEDGIVEVIGEHMARIRVVTTEDVPAFVTAYGDVEFPMKKTAMCQLDNGTTVFYILHEFRDTAAGCDLRVRLIFPAEAPEVFFKEHAEHLAIEFRSGIWNVFAELHSL